MALETAGTNIFDVVLAVITALGGIISYFAASWLRQKTGVIKTGKQEAALRDALQAARGAHAGTVARGPFGPGRALRARNERRRGGPIV